MLHTYEAITPSCGRDSSWTVRSGSLFFHYIERNISTNVLSLITQFNVILLFFLGSTTRVTIKNVHVSIFPTIKVWELSSSKNVYKTLHYIPSLQSKHSSHSLKKSLSVSISLSIEITENVDIHWCTATYSKCGYCCMLWYCNISYKMHTLLRFIYHNIAYLCTMYEVCFVYHLLFVSWKKRL